VEQGYAEKIKRGECVVIEEEIFDMYHYDDDVSEAELASRERFYGTREMYFADTNLTTIECRFDRQFIVKWLDTAKPASEPEALLPQTVDTVRYGTPEFEQLSREDCEREVERLKAELADAQAENARLTERGSIIDWAIETAAVWNNFVSTTDQDAPVSEALALTLNVPCRKVEDYGRKQALAAGIGGGNGEA
jgi:hypothetical protein